MQAPFAGAKGNGLPLSAHLRLVRQATLGTSYQNCPKCLSWLIFFHMQTAPACPSELGQSPLLVKNTAQNLCITLALVERREKMKPTSRSKSLPRVFLT